MVSDMLSEVLEKEKITARNEQNARLEAEKILENANLKAKEIVSNAEAEADAVYKRTVEDAQNDAAASVAAAENEALAYTQKLKEISSDKLGETIDAVKNIILQ